MKKKSFNIGLLIWLFLLLSNASVHGWRTPVGDPISSDYGPRRLSGNYDWHGGIDYASPHGTPVYPVENGTIREIVENGGAGGCYVVVRGSQRFVYCHLSRRYPTSGYPCVAIETHDSLYCIVFRNSQGIATRAYSSQAGIQIDNIQTQANVQENTDFARTGNTGGNYPYHLHISCAYQDDNPLLWVPHHFSNYSLTFQHPTDADDGVSDGRITVFHNRPITERINTRINTTTGLDLNLVRFFIDQIDDAHRLWLSCYGGRENENREQTQESNGTTNGIDPQGNTPGVDDFIYNWDSRTVREGTHSLIAVATNVNENFNLTDYIPIFVDNILDTTPPRINWIEFYENISQRQEYADKLYGLVDIRPNADDQGSGIRRITSRIYETWSIDRLLWTMFITYQISFQQLLSLIDLHQLGIVYENEIRYDIPNYPPFPWDTTKWPEDFQYILEVEVEDFDGNIATTHELLKVDNNAPYLDIVEVYQENPFSKGKSKVKSLGLENLSNQNLLSNLEIQKIAHKLDEDLAGYEQEYCADWIDIDEDSRSLKIHKKKPLLRGIKTKFSLYFSQPIETTYLSAFICPRYNFNKRIELKLYPLDSYGKFFRSEPVIIPSSADFDGELVLNVWARDITYNGLDSDPTTVAVKTDEYGEHIGYEEGADINHSFELPIAPAAPSKLSAKVISQNQKPLWVELSWQDNSNNEDGFRIFYRKDGEVDWRLGLDIGTGNVTCIDVVPPEEGIYFYTIKAFNKTSGYSSPAAEVMVPFIPGGEDADWTPPGGKIIYEQDNFYTRGSITVKARVWDNVGVKKVEFYCVSADGDYFMGESSNFYHDVEGTYTIFEWDSKNLNKAGYGIFCYIRDYANNRSCSENIWAIWTDNIPPTAISNLEVIPANWNATNMFGAGWKSAEDYESYVEGYYYSLNSPPQENASFTVESVIGPLFLPQDTPDGIYNIYVSSRDAAGNIGPVSKGLLFYDITPPLITNLPDTPDIVYASQTVKLLVDVRDEHSGVQWVIISLTSIGLQDRQMSDDGLNDGDEVAEDGIYSSQITIPNSVISGVKNLVITAYNKAYGESGFNFSTATITLQVINPQIINPRITSISPAFGTIGTIVRIIGEGYLPSEQIRIDFGTTSSIAVIEADAYGILSAILTIDSQPYGTKTITATGVLSNTPAEAIFVLLDSLPPTIVNPHAIPEIVKIGKQVTLTAGVTDDYSGVKAVYIDLTPIEGSPDQPMFDDGTNGDEFAKENRGTQY
ncbi:MAG: hypothetical protein AB1414_05555 [bacterium]